MNLLTIGSEVVSPRDLLEVIDSLERKIMFIFAADFKQAINTLDNGIAVSSILFNTGSSPRMLAEHAAVITGRCNRRRIRVAAITRSEGQLSMTMLDEVGTIFPCSSLSMGNLICGLDPRDRAPALPECATVVNMPPAVAQADAVRAAAGSPRPENSGLDSELTPRQLEVLQLVKAGRSNREIAARLSLAEGTVKAHCKSIYRTLGVSNRTEAAMVSQRTDSRLRSFA